MLQFLGVECGFRSLVRVIAILFVILLNLLLINTKVVKATDACLDFCRNLKEIQGKKVTPEVEQKFITSDKKYLNQSIDKKTIELEITELESELNLVKDEYVTTRNNVKLYSGNTALKNNALRTAISNRKGLIENKSSFKYDDRTKYMVARGYDKENRVRKSFTQKDLDISEKAMIEVIENLEMDTSFLKHATFVVSPYMLEGINGYTLSRSTGEQVVVISKQTVMAPQEWVEKAVKSTTLHEIGHVFYNSKKLDKMNSSLVSKYTVNNEIKPGDLSRWKESPTENFAEDFKMFSSSKLGEKSFEPTKKQIDVPYNENEFMKLLDSVL